MEIHGAGEAVKVSNNNVRYGLTFINCPAVYREETP